MADQQLQIDELNDEQDKEQRAESLEHTTATLLFWLNNERGLARLRAIEPGEWEKAQQDDGIEELVDG